jgi:hypothetical protein
MSGWRKRQVVELAERASPRKQDWWKDDDALEAFAALVREDEREKVEDLLKEYDMVNSAFAKDFRARGQA